MRKRKRNENNNNNNNNNSFPSGEWIRVWIRAFIKTQALVLSYNHERDELNNNK